MGDGSTKVLAGMICLILLVESYESFVGEAWTKDNELTKVKKTLHSLLFMHCSRPASTATVIDEAIEFAVRQQQAALAQPLSPFQWARTIKVAGVINIDEYVDKFNSHPSVVANGDTMGSLRNCGLNTMTD
jgi:hypothetical protein